MAYCSGRSGGGWKRKESTFKLLQSSFRWRGVGEGVYAGTRNGRGGIGKESVIQLIYSINISM